MLGDSVSFSLPVSSVIPEFHMGFERLSAQLPDSEAVLFLYHSLQKTNENISPVPWGKLGSCSAVISPEAPITGVGVVLPAYLLPVQGTQVGKVHKVSEC